MPTKLSGLKLFGVDFKKADFLATPLAFIIAYIILFYYIQPWQIFNTSAVFGGDLGSQSFSAFKMTKDIFPGFLGWTNSWYFGLPLFTFYFPIPFYLIALLTKLYIPWQIAFKMIITGGILAIPFSTWYFAKSLKLPAPVAVILFSLFPLFYKENTIIGGSIQSTLAGEFTHIISLNFLFLFFGLVYQKKMPWLAGLLFALTAMSHFLSAAVGGLICLVWFVYENIFIDDKENRRTILIYYLKVLAIFLLLSWWWLIPSLIYSNLSAHTGYLSGKELNNYLYKDPFLILAIPLFLLQDWRKRNAHFILIGLALSILLWKFFPQTGIWSARFLAFYYYFLFIGAASNFIFAKVAQISKILMVIFPTMLVLGFLLSGQYDFIKTNFTYAVSQSQLPQATENLISDLNQLPKGRLINEYNDAVSNFYSPRGFEMLPIYSKQDYAGGLYVESALTAPIFFLIQAEISQPTKGQVGNYFPALPDQRKLIFANAYQHLKFMGIDYVVANESFKSFLDDKNYQLVKTYDTNTTLFKVKDPDPIIDISEYQPLCWSGGKLNRKTRQDLYFDWLLGKNFVPIILNSKDCPYQKISNISEIENNLQPIERNQAKIDYQIDDSKIIIRNAPIGKPLWVKVSYFPFWHANDAKLYHSVPGLMLVVPERENIEIKYLAW